MAVSLTCSHSTFDAAQTPLSLSCARNVYVGLRVQSPNCLGFGKSNWNVEFHNESLEYGSGKATRARVSMMPIALNNDRSLPVGDFIRQLSISTVFLTGLSIGSLGAFSPPSLARTSLASPSPVTNMQETRDAVEAFEDKETNAAFEHFKSKSFALTVPLRVVALEGSLPPVWVREFLKSQGKRVQFRPEFRRSLKSIFDELSNPFNKGKISPKSVAAADLVTLGDSWLNFVIDKGLIEPITGADDQEWFQDLSQEWKVYLRRSSDGHLNAQGRIWAVPYRWGTMVIAYNKREFCKRKLAPLEDWSDLWHPELAGKISMVDSPREIIGAVLKFMGSSYNTTNIDSQVVGGKHAVLEKLESLFRQVRLFDSQHYLKAFRAGDVWVAVGWSSDVLPVAKTMSNVAVIVPKSGASLWADFWAIPATSRLDSNQLGGRVRGPSPLVQQWIDFCLQPERALPFKEEIIPGASPASLKAPVKEPPQEHRKGRPKLETNLVANLPPPEILSKCELLVPLSEDASSDYQWLLQNLQKPQQGIMDRLKCTVSSASALFIHRSKTQNDNGQFG